MFRFLFSPWMVSLFLLSGLLTDARNSLLRADTGMITSLSGLSGGYIPGDALLKPELYGKGTFTATPGATYTVDLIITPVYTSGSGTPVRCSTISVTTGPAGGPFAGIGYVDGDKLQTFNPPLATLGWWVQIAVTGTGTDGSYAITLAQYFSIQPGGGG